jgi:hypothetical protein
MNEALTTTSKDVLRSLGQQSGVSQGQRLFAERTLAEAQELWRKMRDVECGPLAGLDKSLVGDVYERRLRCLIRADRERILVLKRRIGDTPLRWSSDRLEVLLDLWSSAGTREINGRKTKSF